MINNNENILLMVIVSPSEGELAGQIKVKDISNPLNLTCFDLLPGFYDSPVLSVHEKKYNNWF